MEQGKSQIIAQKIKRFLCLIDMLLNGRYDSLAPSRDGVEFLNCFEYILHIPESLGVVGRGLPTVRDRGNGLKARPRGTSALQGGEEVSVTRRKVYLLRYTKNGTNVDLKEHAREELAELLNKYKPIERIIYTDCYEQKHN